MAWRYGSLTAQLRQHGERLPPRNEFVKKYRVHPTRSLISTQVLVRLTNPSLILFYEDLVVNPIDEYYRLASFLMTTLAPAVMLGVVKNTSAASLRAREAQHALPGPNRPGQDTAKVRTATPDAFRIEIPSHVLSNATVAMAPLLHPALRMKWLYNDLDAHFLGKQVNLESVSSGITF